MYQKIINLLFHTFVPAVLMILMLPITAFAQETTNPVSLPVEIQVSGTSIPSDVEYKLVIEGLDNAPMPEVKEVVLKNGGRAVFGPITYTELKDYQYRIYQKSDKKDNFTYDESVYRVTVQVLNDGAGNLKANVVASRENSTEKSGTITFSNKYTKPSGGNNSSSGSGSGGGGGGSPTGGAKNVNGSSGTDSPQVEPTEPEPTEPAEPEPQLPLPFLPKTGDSSVTYAVLIAVMAVCVVMIAGIIRRRKKDEKHEMNS